jgi:hypothetical protein
MPAPLYLVNAWVQHDGYHTGEVVNVRIGGVAYTGEVLEVTPSPPQDQITVAVTERAPDPGTTRAG